MFTPRGAHSQLKRAKIQSCPETQVHKHFLSTGSCGYTAGSSTRPTECLLAQGTVGGMMEGEGGLWKCSWASFCPLGTFHRWRPLCRPWNPKSRAQVRALGGILLRHHWWKSDLALPNIILFEIQWSFWFLTRMSIHIPCISWIVKLMSSSKPWLFGMTAGVSTSWS